MGKKLLSIITLMLSFTFINANYLNPTIEPKKFLDVYQQAIYDTYLQLQDFIAEGVDTYKIKSYDGKIIVGISIDNLPINQIIFYSVIGSRNSFNVRTVYDQHTKRGYLVFGAYNREADANYAIQQLKMLNINAVKIYNGDWFNNPVVVNSIVEQLKNTALANFPIKVIKIKEIYYKEKPVYIPLKPKTKVIKLPLNVQIKKCKMLLYKNNILQSEKARIKELITLIGHLRREAIPIADNSIIGFKWKGKIYKKGDVIDGFKITNTRIAYYIYKCKKYEKIIIKFDDYNNYHLIFRVPLNSKIPSCSIEENGILLKTSNRSNPKQSIQQTSQSLSTNKLKVKKHNANTQNKSKQQNVTNSSNNQKPKKTQQPKENNTLNLMCDYSKIVSFFNPTYKKIVTIDLTPFSSIKNQVILTKIYLNKKIKYLGSDWLLIKPQGFEAKYYIPKEAIKNFCKKATK